MLTFKRLAYFFTPVVIGLLLFSWIKESQQSPVRLVDQPIAKKVRMQIVQGVDFVPKITGFGEVKPSQTWKAVAQVSGRITDLHPRLRNGELISQGDLLIQIGR